MLSAVGLPARFITARAYKKQLLTIRLLIKFTKRKGYDPAYALTGLHTRLSIKKTLKQQAMPRIDLPFIPCSHHYFPTIVSKIVSVLRFDSHQKNLYEID